MKLADILQGLRDGRIEEGETLECDNGMKFLIRNGHLFIKIGNQTRDMGELLIRPSGAPGDAMTL